MAAKELDEGTRAAERAEMRIRLQARPRGVPARSHFSPAAARLSATDS